MTRPLTPALLLAFALTLASPPTPSRRALSPPRRWSTSMPIHASGRPLRADGRRQRPQSAAQRVGTCGPRQRPGCASHRRRPAPERRPRDGQSALLCAHPGPRRRGPGRLHAVRPRRRGAALHHRPRPRRLHRSPSRGPARHEREPLPLPIGLRQELARIRPILLQQLSRCLLAPQGALHPHAHQRGRSLQRQHQHHEPGQSLR